MNRLGAEELWGSGALPPVPAPRNISQFFTASHTCQTDPSSSMDYTSRLPPPHASPHATKGEESHSLCWSGQGGLEDSSAGHRAFCRAPAARAALKCWCTPTDTRGSAANGHVWLSSNGARLHPCKVLLRFEKAA